MKTRNKILAVLLTVTLFTLGCTVDQALTDIQLAIQAAGAITEAIGVISPSDAAIVAGLVGLATKALTVVQQDYDAYKKSKSTSDLNNLQAAVTAVQQNLPAALAAARIEDPVAQQKVTAWVGLTVTTVDAFVTLIPALQAAPSQGAREKILQDNAPSLSPDAFVARWGKDVCSGDEKCSKLVYVPHHSKFVHAITFGGLK